MRPVTSPYHFSVISGQLQPSFSKSQYFSPPWLASSRRSQANARGLRVPTDGKKKSFAFAVGVSSIVPCNQLTRASHWHARKLLLHRSNIARKWIQMARVVVFSRPTSCRPTSRRHRARPRAVRRLPGGCDKYISMHTEIRHTGSVVPSPNASSSSTTRGSSRRFSNSCVFLPSCRIFSSGCGAPIRNTCPGPASNPRPDPAPGSIHWSQRMQQEHHD